MARLAILLLALASSCVSSAHAAPAVIAYSSINPNSAFLEIARAQGFYPKYGLDPEVVLVRSSATATAGLAGGNIHFAYIGGSAVINAAAEGFALKLVASYDAELNYDIVARPDIKKVEDLKGKKFGVGSLGGTPWMAAKLAFEYLGLDEKRDRIQVIAMANQTSRFNALEQGAVDAAVLQGNYSRALQAKGFSVIVDLARAKLPFLGAGVVVSARFLRENQAMVENLMKALLDCQSFINAPGNKPAVLKMLGSYLRETNPAALEEGYQVLSGNLRRKPFSSLAGLNNIRRILAQSNAKIAAVKTEDLIDDNLLRRFDRAGLLDRAVAGAL
ncbi:MAG TPA: ABC transporter substrate-binding protein [Candidatus Binatia bacterium]|jgi:NitT/TauT family transport system substrate-binding protein